MRNFTSTCGGSSLLRVVTATTLLVGASAFAGEDSQYWSTWSVAHNLSQKTAISALAEVYFRDDMRDDYVYDEYVTLSRQLGYGFGVLCSAYFESSETVGGDWRETRSAVAGLTYSTRIPYLGKLSLQDRFYYRVNSASGWDYHRPRVSLSHEFGDFTAMLADEMRVDFTGDRAYQFFRNRVFATLFWKVTKALTLGLGYVRQEDREGDGEWQGFNGVQTVVSVVL